MPLLLVNAGHIAEEYDLVLWIAVGQQLCFLEPLLRPVDVPLSSIAHGDGVKQLEHALLSSQFLFLFLPEGFVLLQHGFELVAPPLFWGISASFTHNFMR